MYWLKTCAPEHRFGGLLAPVGGARSSSKCVAFARLLFVISSMQQRFFTRRSAGLPHPSGSCRRCTRDGSFRDGAVHAEQFWRIAGESSVVVRRGARARVAERRPILLQQERTRKRDASSDALRGAPIDCAASSTSAMPCSRARTPLDGLEVHDLPRRIQQQSRMAIGFRVILRAASLSRPKQHGLHVREDRRRRPDDAAVAVAMNLYAGQNGFIAVSSRCQARDASKVPDDTPSAQDDARTLRAQTLPTFRRGCTSPLWSTRRNAASSSRSHRTSQHHEVELHYRFFGEYVSLPSVGHVITPSTVGDGHACYPTGRL